MILTGHAIRTAVRSQRITIEPFDSRQLNPNSYNYRLGSRLLDCGPNGNRAIDLPKSGFVLRPGRVYLGTTLEVIGSRDFVTLLLGRSSMGRLGLFLNITADLGHRGAESNWTLEITPVHPLRVYAGMLIGQVSFWSTKVRGSSPYLGRYQGHLRPTPNRDRRLRTSP